MINIKDGSVKLEDINFVLSPQLSLNQFKKSKLYNNQDTDFFFSIGKHIIAGKPFYIDVCFDKGYLYSLSFALDDERIKGWGDMKKLETMHNKLLSRYGLNPKEDYDWGGFSSLYDPKSGSSNITILYK